MKFNAASERRKSRGTTPLDDERLRALALTYVARYATTRAKLILYLNRKLRERGWTGEQPADAGAIADRLVELSYIDDAAFARSKSNALRQRGLGSYRIGATLKANGIDGELAESFSRTEGEEALGLAAEYAKRRRIGPYTAAFPDDKLRSRWMAALMRAGHRGEDARRILSLSFDEAEEARIVLKNL